MEMSSAQSGEPSNCWVCQECALVSTQRDEASFYRHLEMIHNLKQKEKDMESEVFARWRDDLVKRAFSHERPSTPASISTYANSQSMGDYKARNLSTSSLEQSDGGRRVANSRSTSSRPASANGLLRLGQSHARPRLPKPQPRAGPEFREHTLQHRTRHHDDNNEDPRRKTPTGTGSSQPSPTSPTSPVLPTQARSRPAIPMIRDDRWPQMIMQADSKGISQDQLANEVRAIYSGLIMVENKAIDLDKRKAEEAKLGPIPADVWRAMIGIHRALLNEHHDFFLASQHPSASQSLHRLAKKYNMPARMWKHGIHEFLEILRHQLPHSREFMVQFIYHAYHVVCLLLETVPAFKDTWVECLGDLSRYRMATEDEDPRDKEIWIAVARYWYCQAVDRMPNVGRLYHHLAILARPNALQMLYLYNRSMMSARPFAGARDSIQALLDPVLRDEAKHLPEMDIAFIRIFGLIFRRRFNEVEPAVAEYHKLLDPYIFKVSSRFREHGVFMVVSIIGSIFDLGVRNHLQQLFELANFLVNDQRVSRRARHNINELNVPVTLTPDSHQAFLFSVSLFHSTIGVVLQQPRDRNTHAFAHIAFCFLLMLASLQQYESSLPLAYVSAAKQVIDGVPWQLVSDFLNTISVMEKRFPCRYETPNFVRPAQGDSGILPEDYLVWGNVWTQNYFPANWFQQKDDNTDEERNIELPSTAHVRAERIMNLGYRLSKLRCVDYNPMQRIWSPLEKPMAYEPLRGQELQYGNNNVDATMSDTSSFTTSLMSDDDDDHVDQVGVEEPRPEFKPGTKLVIDCEIVLSDVFTRLLKQKAGEILITQREVTKLKRSSTDDAKAAQRNMDDALKNEEIEIIDKTDSEEASADDATGIDQENLVMVTSDHLKQDRSPNTTLGNVVILSDDKKVHEQAHLRGIRTIRSDDVRLGLPTTHSPSPSPPSSSSGSDGSLVVL